MLACARVRDSNSRSVLELDTGSLWVPFRWSDHEKAVGSLARRLGFTQVSLSSEVMPMVRAVPRGYTVCADAYLTPKIHHYLRGFISGFKGNLKVCFSLSSPQTSAPDSLTPAFLRRSGCGRPVHAVRRRPDPHGAVLWLAGRSLRSSRRCGRLRRHLLQPGGEETCDRLRHGG